MATVYRSSELKKELQQLNPAELLSLCLRLARFKKENKELLTYLLFKADDQDLFVQEYKKEMVLQFKKMSGTNYLVVKTVRKIAAQMNNQMRYAGNDMVNTELLLHFCHNYLDHVNYKTQYKPLRNLFYRFVEKCKASILKLEEDLQHDYGLLYDALLTEAENKIYWFEKKQFLL